MALTLTIPTPLRRHVENNDTVEVEAGTVEEIIDRLELRYPGLRARLCGEDGRLRRFINIYVDGEDIRFLDNLSTKVAEGAELSILLAIAGG